MTPIRVQLHTRFGTVLLVLASLAMAVGGIAVLVAVSPPVWQMVQGGEWSLSPGESILCLVSLAAVAGGVSGAMTFYNSRHLWIELGADLSRHTLAGVHRHDWEDIDTLRLLHKVQEYADDDEEDTSYKLTTSWVMRLSSGEVVDLESQVAFPGRLHADILEAFRTLVRGLHDDVPETRWHAAEALGRIAPERVPDLNEAMSRMCKAQRKDFNRHGAKALRRAAAFRVTRGRAVPHLIEAAHDEDPRVRRAATQALQRTCPSRYHQLKKRNRDPHRLLKLESSGSSRCRALCETR